MQEDFQYSYYHGTNRLWHTAKDDGDNYQYDPIGNLIKDLKEGVDITWNPYGKVRRVDKTEGDATDFRYDAAGNRIAKIAGADSTIYVRDASGNVMAIYKNDSLVEHSIYGSSRLGLHLRSAKPGYRTLGHKRYELSNHLGNVLATVRDRIQLSSDSTWAEVSSISDFYPFGLTMPGRSLSDSTYRYGFNGKENDNSGEWGSKNHYDYGFRIYNPSLGKFLSVDPLASSFPYLSPYQFAGLDPIKYLDLDGLERAYIDPRSGHIIPASDFHQHTPPPGAIFLNDGGGKREMDKYGEDLKTIGSFIPGLDFFIDGYDTYNDFSNGNYLLGTLSGLSLIPGADFVTKPLKLAIKRADDLFTVIKVGGEAVKNIDDFYRKANKLDIGERIALYKETASEFAKQNDLVLNKNLMNKNKGRTIYTDSNGLNYSLDTQHSRFEVLNKKGKHQGEIDFGSRVTKKADTSGKHDLIVK